jgi:hypothetical protein
VNIEVYLQREDTSYRAAKWSLLEGRNVDSHFYESNDVSFDELPFDDVYGEVFVLNNDGDLNYWGRSLEGLSRISADESLEGEIEDIGFI